MTMIPAYPPPPPVGWCVCVCVFLCFYVCVVCLLSVSLFVVGVAAVIVVVVVVVVAAAAVSKLGLIILDPLCSGNTSSTECISPTQHPNTLSTHPPLRSGSIPTLADLPPA